MTSRPLVWFIAGCSSGFRASLSLLALKAGHKVIATSRNPLKTPELVRQVEELGGTWLPLDVNASNTAQVVQNAVGIYGRIDVLVNNAAYSLLGMLEDLTYVYSELRSLATVNSFST
jgi:NAD(P)-dependent dehydrogenase (short-subunit alcohol dehydrogenase family)